MFVIEMTDDLLLSFWTLGMETKGVSIEKGLPDDCKIEEVFHKDNKICFYISEKYEMFPSPEARKFAMQNAKPICPMYKKKFF